MEAEIGNQDFAIESVQNIVKFCVLFVCRIRMKIDSGNVCFHSVHTLLFFRLLSKNVEIRIYIRPQFCM
jgi:hypothetical protein